MRRVCCQMMAAAVLVVAALAGAASAWAGRSCEEKAPDATAVQRGLELAARTAQALEDSGAEVVVLARAGQDLSKYRLRWSHLGLAYREGGPGTPWRVVHKLNQCGAATADLFRQGLAEFFLDDPFEYRAGFAVLALEAQARLKPLLANDALVRLLHEPRYNMLAYPWAQNYQQSNQWAMETLAMAMTEGAAPRPKGSLAQQRQRAQAWLMVQGYEPTTLRLSAMTRLGARITAANIAFDDHPNDKRFSDRIETTTVDSVVRWMLRTGLAGAFEELAL
jgi:hypothetical protein